jgi:hypothetical protein
MHPSEKADLIIHPIRLRILQLMNCVSTCKPAILQHWVPRLY